MTTVSRAGDETSQASRDALSCAPTLTKMLSRLHAADLQLRLRLQAWHDGYAAGERAHADDYERGFADGVALVKRIEHDLVRTLEAGQVLWIVRGQRRTRRTFADPHPADFRGIGDGAE